MEFDQGQHLVGVLRGDDAVAAAPGKALHQGECVRVVVHSQDGQFLVGGQAQEGLEWPAFFFLRG